MRMLCEKESALLRGLQPSTSATPAEVPDLQDRRPKKKKKTQQPIEINLPPDWQRSVQDLDPGECDYRKLNRLS
jgi:hypothetical protein